MVKGKRLGLVGKVILGAGAVAGLVGTSGCAPALTGVAGYYYGKDKGRSEAVGGQPAEPIERQLAVRYWKDFNGNKKLDNGEIVGEVEDGGSVNMDKYGLMVSLDASRVPVRNTYTFYVLNSEGKRVSCSTHENYALYTASGSNKMTDALEALNHISKESPGEYTIHVQMGKFRPKFFKKTLTIERNPK